MSDIDTEEQPVVFDYKELDAEGFVKIEHIIWDAWVENLRRPEDERQDVDTFLDEYAETTNYDHNRIKFVCTMGTYAGGRDEFLQRSGIGRALYPNGDIYDGEFFEGQKNGRGHYIFASMGRSEVDALVEKALQNKKAEVPLPQFVQQVAKELQIGEVIVETIAEYGVFPCYNGEYIHGLRNGSGWMKNMDSSVYRGEWKDNLRHGTGTMYYVNGDTYSGTWCNGDRDGFGTYVFAGGHSEYKGEWAKGRIIRGQWIMCDETIYQGNFQKNYPHDTEGWLLFPRSGLCVRGVYTQNKWIPSTDFLPIAEAANTLSAEPAAVEGIASDAPNI